MDRGSETERPLSRNFAIFGSPWPEKSSSHQLIWKLRLKLSIAFAANGSPRVVGRCLLIGPPQEMDPMGDNSTGYSLALAVAILWIIMLVVGGGITWPSPWRPRYCAERRSEHVPVEGAQERIPWRCARYGPSCGRIGLLLPRRRRPQRSHVRCCSNSRHCPAPLACPWCKSGCEQLQQRSPLFDHLIGTSKHHGRHIEAERLGGLEVDRETYLVGRCTGRSAGCSP